MDSVFTITVTIILTVKRLLKQLGIEKSWLNNDVFNLVAQFLGEHVRPNKERTN